jgi:hypothetical protein
MNNIGRTLFGLVFIVSAWNKIFIGEPRTYEEFSKVYGKIYYYANDYIAMADPKLVNYFSSKITVLVGILELFYVLIILTRVNSDMSIYMCLALDIACRILVTYPFNELKTTQQFIDLIMNIALFGTILMFMYGYDLKIDRVSESKEDDKKKNLA